MFRALPFLVELAVLVYCLVDCIQTDEYRVRNLPKTGWVILIIILPIVGGVAWLVAGRPLDSARTRRDVPWRSTETAGFPEYERPRPVAPDDDPEFLASVRRSDDTHEKMLRDWEAQLRERERRLAAQDDEQPEGDHRA
ncbi:PLDc N-terminal domain-containing protein [Cellulomonas soli]|uniref:PLDc N-terminal domain-containing protein n=1 Tax=Cellulomonas soli TaxID=931535 RepID=UPI003F87BAD9